MATTYHRYFILPMEGYDVQNGQLTETHMKPKYVSQDDRLDGYTTAGGFTRDEISNKGFGQLLSHNDADKWRIVVAWGEGNDASNALNEIDANNDAYTLPDHDQNVKPILDDHFGEGKWGLDAPPLSDSTNTA